MKQLVKLNFYSTASIFIFFFVNGLFVTKYSREFQLPIHHYFLALLYFLGIAILIFCIEKFALKKSYYSVFFWMMVVCFSVFMWILQQRISVDSLVVDRWEALQTGCKAILAGNYPYDIVLSRGNESSNLPGLILLGMPFYLFFGNVVYLQNFCFLLFVLILMKFFKNYKQRVLALLLLIFSPCYLYELYTKGDLFSNFIILAGFMMLFWKYFIQSPKINAVYVAAISAILVLTRLPVIFPLVILLLKIFTIFRLKSKIIFASVFIVTLASILFFFFVPATSWEIILGHNPFQLQNKQPLWISVLVLILAAFCSFKIKTLEDVIFWSGTLLFFNLGLAILDRISHFGFYNTLYGSYFDISHFTIVLPFVILSLSLNNFYKSKALIQLNNAK